MRERLLRTKDLDLKKAVSTGIAFEESKKHTSDLKKSLKVDKIRHQQRNQHKQSSGSSSKAGQGASNPKEKDFKAASQRGQRGQCPAFGAVCDNCKKRITSIKSANPKS